MKYMRKLSLSLTFICILSAAAFAGETGTPPCAPGETGTPPCPTRSVNDEPVVPGQTNTPPVVPAVDVTDITEAVMWVLRLF